MSHTQSIYLGQARRRPADSVAVQRWGALIGGSALLIYGVTRRSPSGVALAAAGGTLAYLGAKAGTQREPMAHSSVLLNCSPEEAYSYWRDFENLPRFMHHIETVTVQDNRRSRWVAIGPIGARVHWDAEIVDERVNERISWRSLPGSDVYVEGSVEFHRAPADRGTLVTAHIRYEPPAGALGAAVAKIFGKDPNFLMRRDLSRFKALVETGEVPTIRGQSHGPRSVTAAVARVADPDRPMRGEAGVVEILRAERRAS